MQSSDTEFIKVMTEEEYSDHCDQLEMFYDDAESVFGSLKVLLPKAEDVVSYGVEHKNEAPTVSPEEPLGYLAVYPSQDAGLSIVIHCNPKTKKNSIKAVFPFIAEGCKYPCTIKNIQLYPNRLEAQIEAFVDEEQNLLLNFYDTHYMDNRTFYNSKDTFQFILRGFAYGIEINKPAESSDLKKMAGLPEDKNIDNVEIDANGTIALYPREDLGADHYEIQSPVREINEFGVAINGEKVWRIGLVIGMSPDGEEIPLDIYITERCLDNSPLPKVGENISAVVWLQGHMWGIGDDEE